MSKSVDHLSSVDFFAHNDMDMMEIGNGNLTTQEERTHFAVWAFMKSPILLGTDVCDSFLSPIPTSLNI
jgi:alpha-galactosidase